MTTGIAETRNMDVDRSAQDAFGKGQTDGALVGTRMKLLCRCMDMKHPATCCVTPSSVEPILGQAEWARVDYDRCDNFASFPDVKSEVIRDHEQALLRTADDVVYVNESLCSEESDQARRAHYFRPKVDYAHAARDVPSLNRSDRPARIRDLPGPIVSFYGALDDYVIDLDLK